MKISLARRFEEWDDAVRATHFYADITGYRYIVKREPMGTWWLDESTRKLDVA